MVNSEVLVHFLATLAVVLAFLAGCMAIVVLLRLRDWDAHLHRARHDLEAEAGQALIDPGPTDAPPAGSYQVMMQQSAGGARIKYRVAKPLTHSAARVFTELAPRRERLMRQFWRAAAASAAVIVLCLALMPITNPLSGRLWVELTLCGGVLLAGGACGFLHFSTLRTALVSVPEREAQPARASRSGMEAHA